MTRCVIPMGKTGQVRRRLSDRRLASNSASERAVDLMLAIGLLGGFLWWCLR